MPVYFKKSSDAILRQALRKLTETTGITATSPGSIARALVEVMTDELGDFYTALDFNMSQGVLSSASGRSLDLLGQLYNVERKTLSNLAAVDAQVGAFYFYLDTPYGSNLVIPRGTQVSTNRDDLVGSTFIYVTTEDVTIPTGRLRAYASIRPLFEDSIFTAGAHTLVSHNIQNMPVTIKCTNPKSIAATVGYEQDDDYRARIIKGVRVAAGGTGVAMRFAALATPGVRDVKVREAPYGLGTFEVIIVAEDYNVSGNLLTGLRSSLDTIRPPGVRMLVTTPELLYLDVKANVMTKPNVTISTENLTRRVENAILRYINTLTVGQPLVYNQMMSYVFETAEAISDINLTSLSVNGTQVLRNNYAPKENEQLIPGNIEVKTT